MSLLGDMRGYAVSLVRLTQTRKKAWTASRQSSDLLRRVRRLETELDASKRLLKELRDQNTGLRSALVGLRASDRRLEQSLLSLRPRDGE